MKQLFLTSLLAAALFALPSCKKNEPVTPAGASATNRSKENAVCTSPPVLYGVKTFGAAGNDGGNTLDIDAAGNATITGVYQQKVDFNPGPGTAYLNGPTGDIRGHFSVKLNPLGNFISVQDLGIYTYPTPPPLVRDNKGNIYKINVEGRSGYLDTIRVYVAKYDAAGKFIGKAYVVTTVNDAYGLSSALTIKPDNKGNVYVATTLNHLYKFTDTGKLIWERTFKDMYEVTMEFDLAGNIYIFSKSNPSILKFDTSGRLLWEIKDTNYEYRPRNNAFTCDKDGNTYVTGTFTTDYDFDPGAGEYILSGGEISTRPMVFVRKLSAAGKLVWAVSTKRVDALSYAIPAAMRLDPSERYVCVTGVFYERINFGISGGSKVLTGQGGDAFVMSLKQCK